MSLLDKVLPQGGPLKPSISEPRHLLVYSEFKVGKSVLASDLSMNQDALWLDYEDGSEALPGNKINVVQKLWEVNEGRIQKYSPFSFLLELFEDLAKKPRSIVIHDKIDNWEKWCDMEATRVYKNSIIGKNFGGSSVLELKDGGGYLHLRREFERLFNAVNRAGKKSLFFCSMRAKYIGKDEDGGSKKDPTKPFEFNLKDLNLTGQIRGMVSGWVDGPAYMYRDPADSSNWLQFASGENGVFCGNRVPWLSGKKIKLSWVDLEGKKWCGFCLKTLDAGTEKCPECQQNVGPKIVVDWGQIWPSLRKETK